MKTLKSILAALAMTAAATAGAQTLKMEPQVTGITTSEISAVVSLVVVKPEIKILNKTLIKFAEHDYCIVYTNL